MILGFKGFKPGLVATLGSGKFQYVPNELNETKKAMCASTGFHYCLDPWQKFSDAKIGDGEYEQGNQTAAHECP